MPKHIPTWYRHTIDTIRHYQRWDRPINSPHQPFTSILLQFQDRTASSREIILSVRAIYHPERAAVVHCLMSLATKPTKGHSLGHLQLQAAHLLCNPLTTSLCAQLHRILNLVPQVPALGTSLAVPPRLPSTLANIYWTLLIQIVLMHRPRISPPESRSTRPISNVTYVRKSSLGHTIFDHIYARILTKDPSSAQYASKHLHASTTANATRACIQARKSLSAKASCTRHQAQCGAVAAGSLVLTRWADTSGLKPVGYASNHFSMKSVQSVSRR